jgi:hypothetical protein
LRPLACPDWIDSDRFDVQARAETAVSRADTMLMMRAMLADRPGRGFVEVLVVASTQKATPD